MSANIFIVEDEKPIITLLQYNLEKEGYKVNFAETGEEAIQNIKKDIPDLIILDWMLPDFSGIEVCRQIKKINKLKVSQY
jgi:two-component system, OmpR family, phosphate regulon response regulator PhoB